MTENSKEKSSTHYEKPISDFVGIDEKRKRVCVSGHKDNFTATSIGGSWTKGYPEFDDLMDNYSEMKDMERALKYSNDARNHFKDYSNG
jgi:hypothetical protein